MKKNLTVTVIACIITALITVAAVVKKMNTAVPEITKTVILETEGIFGVKEADFEEVILGKAHKEQNLIVRTREATEEIEVTDTGILGVSITSVSIIASITGTGEYTVDLSRITARDITVSQGKKEVTISIPHSEMTSFVLHHEKTAFREKERGLLAFGEVEMTAEASNQSYETAAGLMSKALSAKEELECADDYAMNAVHDLFDAAIERVAPDYRTVIVFR